MLLNVRNSEVVIHSQQQQVMRWSQFSHQQMQESSVALKDIPMQLSTLTHKSFTWCVPKKTCLMAHEIQYFAFSTHNFTVLILL
jgi:hypothetical protein